MSAAVVPTKSSVAAAKTLGLGSVANVFDWMVERFGPALSDILLDLLLKKSQQGALPNMGDLFGAFDLRKVAEMLLERYGPSVLDSLSAELQAREDLISKFVGEFLAKHRAEAIAWISTWLSSVEGKKAVSEAAAKLLATS